MPANIFGLDKSFGLQKNLDGLEMASLDRPMEASEPEMISRKDMIRIVCDHFFDLVVFPQLASLNELQTHRRIHGVESVILESLFILSLPQMAHKLFDVLETIDAIPAGGLLDLVFERVDFYSQEVLFLLDFFFELLKEVPLDRIGRSVELLHHVLSFGLLHEIQHGAECDFMQQVPFVFDRKRAIVRFFAPTSHSRGFIEGRNLLLFHHHPSICWNPRVDFGFLREEQGFRRDWALARAFLIFREEKKVHY